MLTTKLDRSKDTDLDQLSTEIAKSMMLVADAIEILNNSDYDEESAGFYEDIVERLRDLSTLFHAPGEPEEGWKAPVISLDAHRAKRDLKA